MKIAAPPQPRREKFSTSLKLKTEVCNMSTVYAYIDSCKLKCTVTVAYDITVSNCTMRLRCYSVYVIVSCFKQTNKPQLQHTATPTYRLSYTATPTPCNSHTMQLLHNVNRNSQTQLPDMKLLQCFLRAKAPFTGTKYCSSFPILT